MASLGYKLLYSYCIGGGNRLFEVGGWGEVHFKTIGLALKMDEVSQ